MDMLGVKRKSVKKQSKNSKKGIKVVYISSPMKVEICASKFRAIVQELTGKDSDSARFMDTPHVPVATDVHDDQDWRSLVEEQELAMPSSTSSANSNYSYESSSPADSIFDSFDKYLPPMDGSFMSMFQPNFLYEPSYQLDLFN